MIQEAYSRQTATLKHEITHWKLIASQHKEQNATLETQHQTLTRRVAELERALAVQQAEKKALSAAKNALTDRYNALKSNASQLEAFRKSIVSMVEVSSPTVANNKAFDNEFITPVKANKIGSPNIDGSSFLDNLRLDISAKSLDSSLSPSNMESSNMESSKMESSNMESSKMESSKMESSNMESSPVDASTLYKLIRQVLTQEAFESFASTIASFNAGHLSADDTVREVYRIVGQGDLSDQMSRLILDAVRDVF